MTLEQWLYGIMAAVASTFVAIGAFLQYLDAMEEHRGALPDPLELHVNPDAMTTDDLKSDLRQMFSWLGRDSGEPATAEIRALRSAQGWLFVVVGATTGAVVSWIVLATNLVSFLVELSPYIMLVIGAVAFLGLSIYRLPRITREYRQQPRPRQIGIVTFVIFIPLMVFFYPLKSGSRDEKHLARVQGQIDEFHAAAAAVGSWPQWMVGPPPLRVEESTTRVVVEVLPDHPWHPSLRQALRDQLSEAGYRPVRSPQNGWSLRFCDPAELHRWLWEFDEGVVDQPATW